MAWNGKTITVIRHGWALVTFADDIATVRLDPIPEAVDWVRSIHGTPFVLVKSNKQADSVIDAWVNHCVDEWCKAERERLDALKVLDELRSTNRAEQSQ